MPWGYLVTVTLMAFATLCAVAPVRRPWALGRASWMFGFLVNELPFVALCYLAASTLLALSQGDLDSTAGGTGLGMGALTAVGLVVLVWRAVSTGEAVERALDAGLGPEWRAAVTPEVAARPGRRPSYGHSLFVPFLVRRRDVERVANISYGDAGVNNLLDVYRHRSRPLGGPVLVYLHGGGFHRGRKNRESRPLLYRLASQGWVCISANYRLRPAATFPDHLVDAKKVIAWVRRHGQEYGGDPAVVLVAGGSAGAHLAAFAALTPNDPAFQPGFEDADTSVAAAVGLYGYYGNYYGNYYGQNSASSPYAHLHEDAPPFFIAHGDNDTFVPVEGARHLVEELRGVSSSPVVYAELPGGQHSFDLFHSVRFEAVVDGVEAFAAWVRSGDVTRSWAP